MKQDLDTCLQRNHGGDVSLGLGISILVHSGVQVGYVSLVVLGVVQSHDLRIDHGRKSSGIVGQRGCATHTVIVCAGTTLFEAMDG